MFSLAAGRAVAVVTAMIRVDREESLIVTCLVYVLAQWESEMIDVCDERDMDD